MALTADADIKFYSSNELIDLPVEANTVIYKGALVGINATTGYARPLVAGDAFAGLAYRKADNSGGSAGARNVRLFQGIDIVATISGVSQTDVGAVVYASDDATLTLTAAGNSRIGRIVAIEGTDLVRVRLQPVAST